MTENIKTSLINRSGGTQARAALDTFTIYEYSQLLSESGGQWPFRDPIVVFYDGTDYWLADGFHRVEACVREGRFVVPCDVRAGTRREAILHAAGANADHGLRRTTSDKRRAVMMLLGDEEWVQWSDREIARRCNVSNHFVAGIRRQVTGNIPSDERTYTTKHGTVATMNTANIGGRQTSDDDPQLGKNQAAWRETIAMFGNPINTGRYPDPAPTPLAEPCDDPGIECATCGTILDSDDEACWQCETATAGATAVAEPVTTEPPATGDFALDIDVTLDQCPACQSPVKEGDLTYEFKTGQEIEVLFDCFYCDHRQLYRFAPAVAPTHIPDDLRQLIIATGDLDYKGLMGIVDEARNLAQDGEYALPKRSRDWWQALDNFLSTYKVALNWLDAITEEQQ